ncbi:M20/M25/M40 family metallo-hydrolase [Chondromyces crocatus]|uniref:Peptidase M20 n=1 Tax=Chondromyces crocatus TaxID=52 RepID=A0A0K1EBP7_CHOCO|nr:M20/M25/M40 family metallo-hydrolase [Chondromyces crocatus]AKT38311.1 peptidase M20 [Chondromyces crocatus]
MKPRWHHEEAWLAHVARWIALHPTAGSPAAERVATEIGVHLDELGLQVELVQRRQHSPLLIARRRAPPGAPTLGIYGHYDVEPIYGHWTHDPTQLRVDAGRAYGRGIADNLGPLAQRLLAARDVRDWPGIVWVLEGEEETGSPLLAEHLDALSETDVSWWLDETGYFEAPDRQRLLLARWPSALDPLPTTWRDLAAAHAVSTVVAHRELNRASGGSSAPVSQLFRGRPYASFGPNDEASNVHAANESIPLGALLLSAHQFVATLEHLGMQRLP